MSKRALEHGYICGDNGYIPFKNIERVYRQDNKVYVDIAGWNEGCVLAGTCDTVEQAREFHEWLIYKMEDCFERMYPVVQQVDMVGH